MIIHVKKKIFLTGILLLLAMKEINEVNVRATAAVLYYRTGKGAASLGDKKVIASASQLFNNTCEEVLALAKEIPEATIWHFNSWGKRRSTR